MPSILDQNDYPVRIFMFTYSGDQYKLIQSVCCALKVFQDNDVKIFIEDDGGNPISDIVRDELIKVNPERIFYEKTYFNRCKNLNGNECVKSMASIYYDHASDIADKPMSVVIKLDCDTMIANRNVFDDMLLDKSCGCIAASIVNCVDWWGCMYAFRGTLLPAIYDVCSTYDCLNGTEMVLETGDPFRGHEDWWFGCVIKFCCAKGIPMLWDKKIYPWFDGKIDVNWKKGERDWGRLYMWDYRNDKFEVTDERIEEILKYCSIIEMGDGLHENNDVMDAREQRRLMLRFYEHIAPKADVDEHLDFRTALNKF